ncbi:hypothetical protein PCC7424_0132 [Gloeothece citriformis PCC 7424]|uniref:Uncharacterized protein n=1 Tax=Gloeothece citriformis (strain PCC 7424) TaxID=65393 RepID=B7K9B9_GLOC7|nr:hypothetical protein [Gloeothece citriformis]ACK68602.1 hypothetical protein PCC7424_0132 [Gloeothece citriformis PCC 7424]
MKIPLPSFKNWKALTKSPSQRTIKGNSNSFQWGDLFTPIFDIVGWATQPLMQSFGNFNLISIASLFIGGFRFIWNFNWNIPDEDLMTLITNQRLAWFGLFGATIGQSLGWIACGLIPSASLIIVNKPLGLYVLNEVGQEAYDEMITSLGILLQASLRNKMNESVIHSFIAIRNYVKGAARGDDDVFGQSLLTKILDKFPKLKDGLSKWGDKGGKPWVIANEVEEAIEESPLSPEWKVFLEELIEEFGDSCAEALMCFANAFDEYIAANATVSSDQNSPNTLVITPNRKAPEEKIILHGNVNQLKPQITQSLANYQLIYNKNIGYDLGMPLIERAHKQISEYVIKLFLRAKQKPPYGTAQKVEITLNSADKLKFTDYDKIIRALGGGGDTGNFGYKYGNFLAIAQMSDGSTLQCWTDTKDNAKIRLEALAELSEAQIQTYNITEEVKDYQRKKVDGLSKNIVQVYPYQIEVIRKTKVYNDYDLSNKAVPNSLTKPTRQGYFAQTPYTLELWIGKKPANWDRTMQILTAPIPIAPEPNPSP